MESFRTKEIYKVTLIGSFVNVVLIVLKFVAGIVGKSSAMVADAVHSLSDFITDVIVLVFVKIAGRPRDKSHDYGHGKYETFATMMIGLILAIAGIGLFIEGLKLMLDSFHGHVLPRPTMLALIIAVVSIVSKEILFRYTIRKGKNLNSNALIANGWHHRSDAISSLGTLIGVAGAMFLGEKWRFLDPLAAIVVSYFIVKSGYDIMKPSVNELLESSLPSDVEKAIRADVMSVDGIKGVHNLRTRRVGNAIALDMHVKMDGSISLTEAHDIASRVERLLKNRFGSNTMINIHMEPAEKKTANIKPTDDKSHN